MQKFKKSLKILIIFLFSFCCLAENIKKKDISFLSLSDKNKFNEKCIEKNRVLNLPKCINFLGIKIFVNAYTDTSISEDQFKYIEKAAVGYLKKAADKGYKKSYINLGWIYSLKETSIYNLDRSAYYFNQAYRNEVKLVKKKPTKSSKISNSSLDFKNIELAIALMEKIELYHSYKNGSKHLYVNKKEFLQAKKNYSEILLKSNISNENLKKLKEKVSYENKIILHLIKIDLKNFDSKYRNDALANLNRLFAIR